MVYTHVMKNHGEHESVVIALFSTGPISAKEFKKKFPREFEKIKSYTNGSNFTQKMIDNIINDLYGIDWIISNDKYTGLNIDRSDAEDYINRFSDENKDKIRKLIEKELNKKNVEEEIILLSVLKSDFDDEKRDFFNQMERNSKVSGHPLSKKIREYAVGWIRFVKQDNVILITEVQSDLIAARAMANSPIYRAEAKRMGIPDSYLDHIINMIDSVSELTDRIYQDAIAMIFLIAAKEGLSVEMLTSKNKEDSPKRVYEDVPRSMGMINGKSEIDGNPVWKYSPPKI